MIKALFVSSLVLNLSLLLGRLSGFGREVMVAATFGTGSEADIVVLMLTVPDLLVNILMGGAMGAMLIPEFTHRPELSRKLLYQSFLFFSSLFLIVAALLYWQSGKLVMLLAPGFAPEQMENAATALSWVIWLIPLTVSAGIVTAYLNAGNRFAIPALGTLIINCTIIVGLILVFYGQGYLRLLAGFVLLGGILRLISQLIQVKPSWQPVAGLSPILLNKSLLIRYGQAMLSGSVLLLFPAVARALASFEGEGSVALINYSTRLVEFPLAISVTFLSVVLFPRLSRAYAEDHQLHSQLIRSGMQITLVIAVVAAITLITFNSAYAEIVYSYGGMPLSGVELVAELTRIGLFALPLQGLSVFLTSVFNSRKDTRTPMLINLAGLGFFTSGSLMGLFGGSLSGIMWGMVVSFSLICVLQLSFLRIEKLRWWHIFFNKAFLPGFFACVLVLVVCDQLISRFSHASWLSLILAGLVALLALFVAAIFNSEVRTLLKARSGSR